MDAALTPISIIRRLRAATVAAAYMLQRRDVATARRVAARAADNGDFTTAAKYLAILERLIMSAP